MFRTFCSLVANFLTKLNTSISDLVNTALALNTFRIIHHIKFLFVVIRWRWRTTLPFCSPRNIVAIQISAKMPKKQNSMRWQKREKQTNSTHYLITFPSTLKQYSGVSTKGHKTKVCTCVLNISDEANIFWSCKSTGSMWQWCSLTRLRRPSG